MPPLTCGRYDAIENADGTFNVLDVPVFGEMAVGEKNGSPRERIDEDWLRAALEKSKQGVIEGYRAPILVHHSDDKPESEHAGFMVLRRVGQDTVEGAKKWVVYADLENVPRATFDRIAARKLPNRSAEVFDSKEKKIHALSLLTHEVPHFPFPELTVRLKKTPAELEPLLCRGDKTGYFRAALFAKKGVSILCSFDDGKDEKKKDDEGDPEEKGADPAFASKDGEDDPAAAADPADPVAATANDPGATIASLLEGQKRMEGLLTQLVKTLTGQASQTQVPPAETGAVEPSAAAPMRAAKEKTRMPENATKDDVSGLKGENAALRARLDARDKADAIKARMDKARKSLPASFVVDEDTEKEMLACADKGDEDLDRYVAGVKRHWKPDSPRNISEVEARGTSVALDDADVMRMSKDKSPNKIAAMRFAASEYDAHVTSGHPMRMKRERYIETHPRVVNEK